MIAEGIMEYMEFSIHEETEDRFPCRIYGASLKVVTGEDVWRTCNMKLK